MSYPREGGNSPIRADWQEVSARLVNNTKNLLYSSSAITLAGVMGNALTEYQAEPSLVVIFSKYVLPVATAAVVGATATADLSSLPESIQDLNISLSWAAGSALAAAVLVGGIALAKGHAHDMATLPVLDPKTEISFSARELACGRKTSGNAPYVNPVDGQKYLVPCTPNP